MCAAAKTTTTTTTTADVVRTNDQAETIEPTVARVGEEAGLWLGGGLIEPFVTGDRTGGAFDAFHGTIPPGGGPPPHIHRREDELFYVVDGDFQFTAGEHTLRGGPGTCLFLPRHVVHQFRNVGATTGRMFNLSTPGGFLTFAAEAGEPAADRSRSPQDDDVNFARLAAACAKHHIDLLPTWDASKPAPPRRPVRDLMVLGLGVRVLLTSDETRGQLTVAEVTAPRHGDGASLHAHRREDELFFVLDGTFVFELPARTVTATPGTFLHVPRGIAHAFHNPGNSAARMLDIHAPGGFEDFFFEAASTNPRGTKQVMTLLHKHGMDVHG